MGAVLTQQYGEELLPVAFFSKRLNPAEKELLGLITSLLYFKYYLFGRPVLVRTDHKALKYLLTQKDSTGSLEDYYLSRRGEADVLPPHDNLEKEQLQQQSDMMNLDPTLLCGEEVVEEVQPNSRTQDNSLTQTKLPSRPFLLLMRHLSEAGRCPSRTDPGGSCIPMQTRSYALRDGFLFFTDSLGRESICIPYSVCKRKVMNNARQVYRIAISYRAKLSVDLLTSKRGNDSVLVFLDQFSNRVFLYPCKKSINSKGAAKAYFETVYRAQGICKTLVLDNGNCFHINFGKKYSSS
eukprot:765038-Hanusia_phi.AAC.1